MSRSFNGNGALGIAFQVCRALQLVLFIACMGMTARFISEMVDAVQQPPSHLIGTLCVSCLGVLHVVISYILYFDGQLPKLYTAVADTLFFLGLLVISIVIGKPLSVLSCKAIGAAPASSFDPTRTFTDAHGNGGPTTAASTAPMNATTTPYLTPESGTVYHLRSRSTIYMQSIDFSNWVGSTQRACDNMKAVWGLTITLTVLFVFSAVCLVFLWKQEKIAKEKSRAEAIVAAARKNQAAVNKQFGKGDEWTVYI